MSEQLTIKNLYNHMDETIAKDIFEALLSQIQMFSPLFVHLQNIC